jgi:serine/threonine protein kinase
MLRVANQHRLGQSERPPSSPIRRLVEPVRLVGEHVSHDAEFVSSTPSVQEGVGSRIRRESFSPNYFSSFFKEEAELGRGGKGVVLLVRHEIDGCHLGHFACKRVPVGDDHAWLEKVLVEVELLAKLSHPNLVSYRHVWLEDVQLTRFGPSVACAFILQQYCNGGDLLQYVVGDQPKETTKEELKAQMRRRSKGNLEQRPQGLFSAQRQLQFEEIYSLFKDITSGLAYLHAANYIHRDLKPSNCLLHREGSHLTCLISDFGEVQPEHSVRTNTGSTGTISYCAPEVLKKDSTGLYGNFTTKSDIFSLGMILYFLCFGRLPYNSANTVHEELEDVDLLRAEITDWKGFQDERRARPDLPSKLYQLLKRLLAVNPQERPSANEVLSAMKTDATLDGVPRAGRSSSPTFGLPSVGRRIQNLDSPLAPSTPVNRSSRSPDRHPERGLLSPRPGRPGPNPTRHAKVASSSDEDLRTTTSMDDVHRKGFHTTNIPPSISNTPRHRHTTSSSLALARSQDAYPPSFVKSPSPERAPRETKVVRPQTPESSVDGHETPVMPTPLLMAPPTTALAELRHRATVLLHNATRNKEQLAFVAKLVLFLLKMGSLVQICWPYSVGRGVAGSLVVVAGVDLGVPWVSDHPHLNPLSRDGDGGSGSTTDHANYEGERPRISPRSSGGQVGVRSPAWRGGTRGWDWRASLALAVVHFLVLAVVRGYGKLCAVPSREGWERW